MLSASHNAMPDNGIKFFARGGHKLADELEDRIEAVYEEHRTGAPWDRPTGAGVGRVAVYDEGFDQYVAHLVGVLPNRLDGLKVVLDEAHGAAARVSPEAFARAGAEVITIGAEPDGLNINDGCGSTHLDLLKAAVVEHGADLGIAHDGDADRCLAVDHTGDGGRRRPDPGRPRAGDARAGRAARRHRRRHRHVQPGLQARHGARGLELVQTAVGDRYVLEEMKEHGYALGGEQSGHVIVLDHATTGDGTLTGLLLAARVAQSGRSLRELAARHGAAAAGPHQRPRRRQERGWPPPPELAAAVADAERELGATGRVLLRPSGTEPLVRVMVEAADIEQARSVAGRLADAVKSALAGLRSRRGPAVGARVLPAAHAAGLTVTARARRPPDSPASTVGPWGGSGERAALRWAAQSRFWASRVSVPARTMPSRFSSSCFEERQAWPVSP